MTLPPFRGPPSFRSFSLIDAIMCRDVPTILTDVEYAASRAYKSLNSSEIDMVASKAKAEGSGNPKEMTYHDFVKACKTLGEQHYAESAEWLENREIEAALRKKTTTGSVNASATVTAAANAADDDDVSGNFDETGSEADPEYEDDISASDASADEDEDSVGSKKMVKRKESKR